MNEAKLLLDMVGQKLVSKERFPIISENGTLLIINLKFNTVLIDGHWTRLQNKDVLPSGVTEAK